MINKIKQWWKIQLKQWRTCPSCGRENCPANKFNRRNHGGNIVKKCEPLGDQPSDIFPESKLHIPTPTVAPPKETIEERIKNRELDILWAKLGEVESRAEKYFQRLKENKKNLTEKEINYVKAMYLNHIASGGRD